VQKLTQQFADT